jgi:dTDP-3-amino-3,4,6-trideoxy-alpha-D-glucose transaminase
MAVRVGFGSPAPREEAQDVAAAIARVVASGWFVLGPEVDAFESEFAAAQGAACAVGVGNGTDALALILRGLDIGPGDEVITSPLSAAFTALAIMMVGARPVFADIDPDRMTIDPAAIATAITSRTRAIMPVHLYGQAADMDAIERIAVRHGLPIVEDCCQAHLATAAGRSVGTIGVAGAFSFYPTKNLGALGDGGAVVTNDRALAERIKRLRNGGQSAKYRHDEPGINSRLDEMQAAILRARLTRLPAWTARRRVLAAAYRAALADAPIAVPPERDAGHVYHLFVVRSERRDALREHLDAQGVETLIHYPSTIPSQGALARTKPAPCERAAAACREVVSLPLYPALTDSELASVAAAVCAFGRKD